jgi:hypothetical protein
LFQKSKPNVSGSSFANERIAANGFFPHASRPRVLVEPSRNGVFTANSRAEIALCRPDCVRRVDAVVNLTIFNSDQRPGPCLGLVGDRTDPRRREGHVSFAALIAI